MPLLREIAITFDDLPYSGPELDPTALKVMTYKLIKAVQAHEIVSVCFVNEERLYDLGQMDARIEILKMWLDAGFELGNHTYSHKSLQTTPVDAFKEDVMLGEVITSKLLKASGQHIRYFRYPYLRTGPTQSVKTEIEHFLFERGYTIAPVTIHNSDWIFSRVYHKFKIRKDEATMLRIGDAYLKYTRDIFGHYEKLSIDILGYQIKHTMLLHATELNADFFDKIAQLLKSKGYTFIALEEALEDTVYGLPDHFVGDRRLSWLQRWFYQEVELNSTRQAPEPPEFIFDLEVD